MGVKKRKEQDENISTPSLLNFFKKKKSIKIENNDLSKNNYNVIIQDCSNTIYIDDDIEKISYENVLNEDVQVLEEKNLNFEKYSIKKILSDDKKLKNHNLNVDKFLAINTNKNIENELVETNIKESNVIFLTREEICPICNKDIRMLNDREIDMHVNKCLDVDTKKNETLKIKNRTINSNKDRIDINNDNKNIPNNKININDKKNIPNNNININDKKNIPNNNININDNKINQSKGKNKNDNSVKPKKICPFYKILTLATFKFVVDGFCYGKIQEISNYFLSHFHSDHYIGLSKKWTHGKIYCSEITAKLVMKNLYVQQEYLCPLPFNEKIKICESSDHSESLFVTLIDANHCPGAAIFLFEGEKNLKKILHTGDFRASPSQLLNPLIRNKNIDELYLDTTYLNPKYSFPPQCHVVSVTSHLCEILNEGYDFFTFLSRKRYNSPKADQSKKGLSKNFQFVSLLSFVKGSPVSSKESSQSFISSKSSEENNNPTNNSSKSSEESNNPTNNSSNNGYNYDADILSNCKKIYKKDKLLIVVGTYTIGKENVALDIAKKLKSKIYADKRKREILGTFNSSELNTLLTDNPRNAQVHLIPMSKLNIDSLKAYLSQFGKSSLCESSFDRVIGIRPTGWSFRLSQASSQANNSNAQNETPFQIAKQISNNSAESFSLYDISLSRGSQPDVMCCSVPYSEHSSFRDLTCFCTSVNIQKIIPTVNVHNPNSRSQMKKWIDAWNLLRNKNGIRELLPSQQIW